MGTFDPTAQTMSLTQILQPRWRLQPGSSKLGITLPSRLHCKPDNTHTNLASPNSICGYPCHKQGISDTDSRNCQGGLQTSHIIFQVIMMSLLKNIAAVLWLGRQNLIAEPAQEKLSSAQARGNMWWEKPAVFCSAQPDWDLGPWEP